MLYPMKFKPIFKDKIWGGDKIKTVLKQDFSPLTNAGEAWMVSGVEGNVSEVQNGFLAGNPLDDLIEVYMSDLVGDLVFQKFGQQFPLLIKFIDANDYLSIQVHPNDRLAMQRHNSMGKTEMWYIIDAEPGSELITGFSKKVNQETYLTYLKNKTLKDILNVEKVKPGDVFYIPSGRVHALGPGILLAEIQQTSDVTYRIYDWDRTDSEGKSRELHTDEALDAIDFEVYDDYKTHYKDDKNASSELVNSEYFTTNLIHIDKALAKDYTELESFVINVCIEGSYTIQYRDGQEVQVNKGESVLIPAELNRVVYKPHAETRILETYVIIPKKREPDSSII
ncbi:MAG: class I mannose-6-phosphate isomerase [Bacteroidales bacterium]|nr:class I mannose-6-phosphate isomerase [Bacteroidales bacterium]